MESWANAVAGLPSAARTIRTVSAAAPFNSRRRAVFTRFVIFLTSLCAEFISSPIGLSWRAGRSGGALGWVQLEPFLLIPAVSPPPELGYFCLHVGKREIRDRT